MEIFTSHVYYISKKAYDLLLSSRPYKTEIRQCHCYMQDCRGKFLVKEDSLQTVCYNELIRIKWINTQKQLKAQNVIK